MRARLCGAEAAPADCHRSLQHGAPDAAKQLPHAPLMKVLGLPAETNPEVVSEVLKSIADAGPHRAVALVRQSGLMALLPPGRDPAALAADLVRLARMSRVEMVMQALRR